MKNNKSTIALILAGIAIVLNVIFFICFRNTSCSNTTGNNAVAPPANNSGYTVACVNTDTLFAKFDMATDMIGELEQTEKKLTADLKNRAEKFKADYENYLKTGASMTLSEQKKKEAQLTQTQQTLAELEKKYAEQLMKLRVDRNQEVNNKIFSFIEKYNTENGKYTFVISNSRTSGVLYSPESIDITDEIINALNKDYHAAKK